MNAVQRPWRKRKIVAALAGFAASSLSWGCCPMEESPYLEYHQYRVRIMDISEADSKDAEITGDKRFKSGSHELGVYLDASRLKSEPDTLEYCLDVWFSDNAKDAIARIERMRIYAVPPDAVTAAASSRPETRLTSRTRKIQREDGQVRIRFTIENTIAKRLYFEIPVEDFLPEVRILGISATLQRSDVDQRFANGMAKSDTRRQDTETVNDL